MTGNILIVEDEADIRELIALTLANNHFEVRQAANASQARRALADSLPDLAIVDWMMPVTSGIDLLREIRRDDLTRDLPVIMLTARSSDTDITHGLDSGADDYLAKPFSPAELVSRTRAVLRRAHGHGPDRILKAGNLQLDEDAHRVSNADGEDIALGETEYRLLRFFMRNPDRVYSRAQLLDHVWGRNAFIEERTVDVHVLRLRKTLGSGGIKGLIDTVRGAGYRLTSPPG
jgi:two-component system phosphate regulon response regulator PhoB